MITKEAYERFKEFLLQYEQDYNPVLLDIIKKNFKTGINSKDITDVLKQVYVYLDILPEEQNTYKMCLNIIKEEYGLEQDILEIGAGAIPILSIYIENEQKKGTITAYDKNLVPNSLGKIKIYKQNFTKNDSTKNYDLVIGIYPCEASSLVIEKASEENNDMFLLSCDCTHFSNEYLRSNYAEIDDWHNYLYNLARLRYDNKKEIIKKDLIYGNNVRKRLIYTKR